MENSFKPTFNKTYSGKAHAQSAFIKQMQIYYFTETLKLSLVTGPIYTIAGTFQYISKSRADDAFKRKAFKPNFFAGYLDLYQYLFKQGILGLYKGNLMRIIFFTSTAYSKKYIEVEFEDQLKFFNKFKFLKEYFLFSAADIFFNPFLAIETKLLIQNRIGNFSIHNNFISMIKENGILGLYKGSSISLYRNLMFVLGINLYFPLKNMTTDQSGRTILGKHYGVIYYISIFVSHVLSYPFLTIQRNIISRSILNSYYEKDLVHNKGFLRIKEVIEYFKVFGVKSLYRGFPFYISAIGLWHYYVPSAAKYKHYQNLL